MKNKNKKEINMIVEEIKGKIKAIESSIIDNKIITTAKSIDGKYGIDENVFVINQGRLQMAMMELEEYLSKILAKLKENEIVLAEGKVEFNEFSTSHFMIGDVEFYTDPKQVGELKKLENQKALLKIEVIKDE